MRVLYHGADLAKPAEIAELMRTAIEAFGAVDILVNNAVVRHFAPVHEFPGRGMGSLDGGQHFERVPHHPAGRARHARARLGAHRQYVFDLWPDRRGEPRGLRDQQDSADRHDARGRARVRAIRDHLQRRSVRARR